MVTVDATDTAVNKGQIDVVSFRTTDAMKKVIRKHLRFSRNQIKSRFYARVFALGLEALDRGQS